MVSFGDSLGDDDLQPVLEGQRNWILMSVKDSSSVRGSKTVNEFPFWERRQANEKQNFFPLRIPVSVLLLRVVILAVCAVGRSALS